MYNIYNWCKKKFFFSFQVKIWFQNHRYKCKRQAKEKAMAEQNAQNQVNIIFLLWNCQKEIRRYKENVYRILRFKFWAKFPKTFFFFSNVFGEFLFQNIILPWNIFHRPPSPKKSLLRPTRTLSFYKHFHL